MRRQRWWVPLLALVIATSWKPTLTLPVPEEELDTSTKLLGSSVVTSVSIVTGSENGSNSPSNADRSRVIPSEELPGSPAGMLRPDRFQFYTLNKDGDVVTKQMTEQEIQSLIAAGGGHLPMEIHEPQSAGDIPSGGMKVADVVQNVQNVLKGELSKPAAVMTSMPTIPGHANEEWSSILPAILGGESESGPISESSSETFTDIRDTFIVTDTTMPKAPDSLETQTNLPVKKPSIINDYENIKKPNVPEVENTEKPMIQVPVITVDQKQPAHQEEEDVMPVFQMLNTISADRLKPKNSTQVDAKPDIAKPQKTELLDEKITKPEKVTTKPIQKPFVEPSNTDAKAPEMVKINLSIKKPIQKPDSIITTEISSQSPQTEPPAIVSVVSETHSTSIKVSGQEEISLRDPLKPQILQTDHVKIPSEKNKPEVTGIPITNPSTEFDSTTIKAERSTTPAQVTVIETSEKPGLITQGVSFIGNLPQTVGSIITDFLSIKSPSSKPTTEEAQVTLPLKISGNLDGSLETKDSTKTTSTTETSVSQTTPIQDKPTSKKPDEEPVYQMIPEIIPDKKISPHGASQSEVSSIEHIIETLNDPTGSLSGTVAAEHYGSQINLAKSTTVAENRISTTATSINVETPVESSSAKPIEPLANELADSLTSMISQISDAMPSVLPVNEKAGQDTTEKKNVVDMQAEEPGADETTQIQEITKVSKKPTNKIVPPVDPTKLPETKDPTISTTSTSKTTEKLQESTTPVTTQSPKLDISTTVKIDLNKVTPEVPVNKIETNATPSGEKFQVTNGEIVKAEADPVLASSEVATDKIMPAGSTEPSVMVKNVTVSAITKAKPVEKISTEATTAVSFGTSVASPVLIDNSEAPMKVQTDSPSAIEAVTLKTENHKNDGTTAITLNENNTEMPIVHIDIKEAKPTNIYNTNKSQVDANYDNGNESPLVRIQLTDPTTLINNMIQSANVSASARPVESLILPETGSVPPNSIASGLIAGFPSSTTQSSTRPEMNPTTIDTVQTSVIQPGTDENKTAGDSKTSDIRNITNAATSKAPERTTQSSVTNKILEASTVQQVVTAKPMITVQAVGLPIEVVRNETEKKTTIQANVTQRTTTDKPKKKEPIVETASNKNTEISSIPVAVEIVNNNSTKLSENVTVPLEETTISSPPNAEATKNEASTPAISVQSVSSDKLNEASKIVEIAVSTSAKPDVTSTVTTEMKMENPTTADPVKSVEPTDSTLSEAPIVRIDVAPEVPQEMPSKIQLTDLPIAKTTVAPTKPTKEEKIESSESVTTTTLKTTVNSDDVSQATTISSTEKTVIVIEKEKLMLKDDAKQPMKTENGSDSSNKIVEPSISVLWPQQTEEVRIRVNNTAVLVSKRPVSEPSSQTLGDDQKTRVNQPIDEHSTTPNIAPVTEGPLTKLPEKMEHLAGPVKVSDSSSIPDGAPTSSPAKTDAVSSSGTETRIRLGEEQPMKGNTGVKVEDPRKPIKKNSDVDSSQPAEEKLPKDSTTKVPSTITDNIPAHQDYNTQPSIKVELTTSASSEKPSTTPKISSSKTEDKPAKLNDKPLIKVTDRPVFKPSKTAHKPTMIKKDDALPGSPEDKWTLIPQQVYPALTKPGTQSKRPTTTEEPAAKIDQVEQKVTSIRRPPVPLDHPQSASGLDSTVQNLETDISYFANLCNELAFTFWTATNKGLITARSLAVSPFGMTSMLAMVFLGARGPTSDQMNDILKLDDVASFNPHLVFQNVTDAVGLTRNQGIANAAFVRELFVDRSKVRELMPFYKKQAQQFYDGIVTEVNFASISDVVRRRTNLMIRKETGGRIKDFVRTNTVPLRSPLAVMSANVFQTDCSSSAASSEGRDGELYFAVSPAVRQRKLVPVPATVWRSGVLAGYEPSLDATAIALGGIDKLVSTIFVIPGQQGHTAPGDSLEELERRLVRGAIHDGAWNKLLKILVPRPGLELQVPKFSHRSIINATAALKRMGLEELFSKHADLKGIIGIAPDLHLADVLQMNLFSTCGDENILSGRHHVEVYPGNPQRNAREHRKFDDEKDEFFNDLADDEKVFSDSSIPFESASHREVRSARQADATEKPRLKLDRPFLYFVRHNPTGLILHMGRFNPRLLP